MCIIAAKKINTPMPTDETIENMWYSNPDGAGFMYAKDSRVHIEKGFMTLAAFTTRLAELGREIDLTAHSLVMHFRITTHGGTRPENCHPFPVSDNLPVLKKLQHRAKLGVAHNGMIPISPRSKDISDTMEYIASQLAPLHRFAPTFFRNKDAMTLVKNGIQSKMCFMDEKGNLYTVGDFVTDGGMLYSNRSYESSWKSFRGGSFSAYGDWGDWGDWDYYSDYLTSYETKTKSKTKGAVVPLLGYGGSVNSAGLYVEARFLMWLYDIGGYAKDAAGELLEGEELLIDRDNNVWVYDYETDTCFPFPDVTAFNAEGLPAKYDYKLSERMYCEISHTLDENR